MNTLSYPISFPNSDETTFLKLILCSDSDFPKLFEEWKSSTVFEDIDYATSRLLPLVYLRLKKLNYSFDDSINGRIKGVYRLAWVKNQQLLGNLGEVCTMLKQHNISVLLLKGVSLLVDVYQDSGARFVGDADMLVHPSNAKKTIELMLEHGWHLHMPRPIDITKFSETSLPRIVKEFTFSNEHGYELDIHWRLFERTGKENEDIMSFDTLWEHKRETLYKDQTFNVISPEDMILHVIIHGAEGNNHRTLRWVTDSFAIINKFSLDWEQVAKRATTFGFNAELYFALSFLMEHGLITKGKSELEIITKLVKELLPTLTKNILDKYYRKANSPYTRWGGFPRLWRTFWRFENNHVFPISLYYCFEYLCNAWGFKKKSDLIPFVWNKYRERISYLFSINKK